MIPQLDLTNKYRTLYPTTAEYTFFLSMHRPFSGIDHMLCCKTGINNFKKIEIIAGIFSDHNGWNSESIAKKPPPKNKIEKLTNMWKLNNTLLNNQWIKEENTGEIRKYLETN